MHVAKERQKELMDGKGRHIRGIQKLNHNTEGGKKRVKSAREGEHRRSLKKEAGGSSSFATAGVKNRRSKTERFTEKVATKGDAYELIERGVFERRRKLMTPREDA